MSDAEWDCDEGEPDAHRFTHGDKMETKHTCGQCGKDCGGCGQKAYQCDWLLNHACKGRE